MDHREHLPIGAELVGDYLIEGILGSGGFGVTYAARDVRLGTRVAIKEYFPSDFGTRDGTLSIHPKSGRHAELFEWGRTGFLDEARTLARFDHPAIVRVIRVFEALNTAYMVLKFEEGQSLKSWLDGLARRPTQDELDRIVGPLLDALEVLHASDFLHRDIAPDNIIVRPDGSPVLLDFGSARQAIAQETKTLTGIVKPGYSPPEQYSARSTRQGPWTDIYALGATLYKAVTGVTPVDGPDRVLEDTLEPVAANAGDGYRTSFLDAIDLMLRVRPEARPQSIAALRAALSEVSAGSSGTVTVRSVPSALPSPAVSAPSEVIAEARQSETRELRPRKPYALLALMGAALIGLGVYLARDGLSPGPTSRSGEPKRMAQVPQPPNDPPKERAKPLEPRDERPAELPPVAPRALPPSQPQMPPAPVPKEDRRADPAPSPVPTPAPAPTQARGWLGVRIQDVTKEIAESLGLADTNGALIAEVTEGGPSAQVLRRGDVILEVAGTSITNARDLARRIAAMTPRSEARLLVLRDGQRQRLSVPLGTLPAPPVKSDKERYDDALRRISAQPLPGLEIAALTDELRRQHKLQPEVQGVVVTSVSPQGQGPEKRLVVGHVVVEINGESVRTIEDVRHRVATALAAGRTAVLLRVAASGRAERFVALRLEAR